MKRVFFVAMVVLFGTILAAAQDWPTKLVKIVVPFAAGATPDVINTLLFSNLPYNPRKDLTLISLLVTQPSVLAVNAALGAADTRALIEVIRRDPGKYAFGSIGAGSLSHLAMEAIALKSRTQLVHVPYPSSPQAVTALLRNDVQMVCLPAISIVPQLRSGAVKM